MYVAHPRRKIHVRIPELLHQECMRVRAPHASQCVYEHRTHPSACTSTARIPVRVRARHASQSTGARLGVSESAPENQRWPCMAPQSAEEHSPPLASKTFPLRSWPCTAIGTTRAADAAQGRGSYEKSWRERERGEREWGSQLMWLDAGVAERLSPGPNIAKLAHTPIHSHTP